MPYGRSGEAARRTHPRLPDRGDQWRPFLMDEEVIANVIVTMVGGQETTTNLIGNGILTLLRNPVQLQRLRRLFPHPVRGGRVAPL